MMSHAHDQCDFSQGEHKRIWPNVIKDRTIDTEVTPIPQIFLFV